MRNVFFISAKPGYDWFSPSWKSHMCSNSTEDAVVSSSTFCPITFNNQSPGKRSCKNENVITIESAPLLLRSSSLFGWTSKSSMVFHANVQWVYLEYVEVLFHLWADIYIYNIVWTCITTVVGVNSPNLWRCSSPWYHDSRTGDIPLSSVEDLQRHAIANWLVKKGIPISHGLWMIMTTKKGYKGQ